MSGVAIYASLRAYLDHLIALYEGLPPDLQQGIYVHHLLRAAAPPEAIVGLPPAGQATVVAGIRDVQIAGYGRSIALLEHGAGQTYWVRYSSNPGGPDREGIGLFLHPNFKAAGQDAEKYPGARVAVVGSPRLDRMTQDYRRVLPASPGTIALTFHWDMRGSPEGRWAFPHYQDYLGDLTAQHRVLAHAHPRVFERVCPLYEEMGFTPVVRFEDLFEADLLVLDTSSAGPEWCAVTGKPLLWLNAPWYRRDVHQGGRWWTWTEGQVTVDGPDELEEGIAIARADPPEAAVCREKMVQATYPVRGDAALKAASAIRRWLEEH